MSEDYSDYPKTIGEIRSDREDAAAEDWAPRDALISALRDIDAGEWKPSMLLVVGISRDENGYDNFRHLFAGGYYFDLLALIERAKIERS